MNAHDTCESIKPVDVPDSEILRRFDAQVPAIKSLDDQNVAPLFDTSLSSGQ